MTNNENIERKKLKEKGHTDSYIEWMIWRMGFSSKQYGKPYIEVA